MNRLYKLNPAKSLFFRVFLWFWLGALLIFFSSIWLAKHLDSETRYMPLKPKQKNELANITESIRNRVAKRGEQLSIDKLLALSSARHRTGLVLVNLSTREITTSVVDSKRIKSQYFDGFEAQNSPLVVDVEGLILVGPSLLAIKQSEYLLFTVVPRRGGSIRVMRHEYPGLFFLFLVSLSGGLCYVFVRSLLRPIVQLQNASKRMAAGDMAARVGSASTRLDEIGQLGRDFNNMSLHVEQLLNNQKRLLADISHELRSPLARLQLSIGIALQQNESEVSPNIQAALERIEKESLQIEGMIGQVLMLSRLDNQQPIQNLQTVNLEQIMHPIIADGQFEAEQNNKEVIYHGAPNVQVRADPQLLSSAIENILRNAIHYSNHKIEVTVTEHKNEVVWVIKDDGQGIDASLLDKIFEPFYRESTARDRHSGGVGLGLAIAQHAINKHQGNIKAETQQGSGLQVTISIPIVGF